MKIKTLSNINDNSAKEISKLHIETIYNLLNQSVKLIKKYQRCKEIIEDALLQKYSSQISYQRKFKKYNLINIEDGDYITSHNIPKKITWDQTGLEYISQLLQSEGEDPTEFIDIKLNISERRYDSWPESIQNRFKDARTVDEGIEKISVRNSKVNHPKGK